MGNLKRLFYYLADYKGSIVAYFVCSLLATMFSLFSMASLGPVLQVLFLGSNRPVGSSNNLPALLNNFIFNLIDTRGSVSALAFICLAIVLFILLKNLFLYLSIYLLAPLRNAILRRLRNELFVKMLSLPISYFTDERKGDLMSKMTNDINEVEVSVISVLEVLIREPLTILIFLGTMIAISPSLSLFIFIFLPLAGLVIGLVSKSLRRSANISQQYLADILAIIDETLSGMRVVKAFNAERHQQLRFTKMNNKLFRVRNKISARRELASPLSEVMGIIVVSVILWVGGRMVLRHEGALTGPTFVMYLGLFTQIINPFKNLSSAYSNLKKGSAALSRIESILQVEAKVVEKPNALPIKDFKDTIELRNVSFSYGEKEILKNIDLTIKKGSTVALVGASGAGKSTLADLIPRFHDVSEGELLIDGIDVKDYKISGVRRLIGVVSQDPILFNDTIYNNIALGSGAPRQAQVEEAAKVAGAFDFITKKPLQFDTEVGDRGSRLSGGERQRITIARAVLKNPSILILDEATSSLDTESERMVQNALNSLMQNRTCIVIAHRLSTVRNADEIVVLHQGRIVERGNHTDLMQQDNGYYRRLVNMQELK